MSVQPKQLHRTPSSEAADALVASKLAGLQVQIEQLTRTRAAARRDAAEFSAGSAERKQIEGFVRQTESQIDALTSELNSGMVAQKAQPYASAAADVRFSLPALPSEYVWLSALFMLVTLLPLSIALAKRTWPRRASMSDGLSPALRHSLTQMQDSIDAVAVEVERIGEAQRFASGLIAAQASSADAAARSRHSSPVPPRDARSMNTPH